MPDNNGSDLGALLSSLLQNKNLKRKFEVYADRLLNKRTKYEFARHITPSDIISSITLKLLTGTIKWNNKTCTLPCFFYRRIMTEIFNLTKREKKFIPVPLEKSESVSDYEGEIEDDVSLPPEFIIDPFEENEKEEEIDPVEFKKIAYEIFQDSLEEYCVLDEMFKGHQTKQIAVNLGTSEIKVYNIKKRITRVLKAWVLRNKKGKDKTPKLALIINNNPVEKPVYESKPGKSTPENNNNGELS
jgi:hypothetical protein